MRCILLVNVKAKYKNKIVEKVLGVVNLSQSIIVILIIKRLVTLTIGRIKRHALYLLRQRLYGQKLIQNTGSQYTWNAMLCMFSCTKAVVKIKQ